MILTSWRPYGTYGNYHWNVFNSRLNCIKNYIVLFFLQNIPVLIIGHHILYGKVMDMEKPLAVLLKCHKDSSTSPSATPDTQHADTHYNVKAIIRKRLLFKNRPKPIIANVPKKL